MNLFVDQINDKKVTLIKDKHSMIIDLALLPKNIKEGDYINCDFKLNKDETLLVKNSVKGLIKTLSKSKGGDFDI